MIYVGLRGIFRSSDSNLQNYAKTLNDFRGKDIEGTRTLLCQATVVATLLVTVFWILTLYTSLTQGLYIDQPMVYVIMIIAVIEVGVKVYTKLLKAEDLFEIIGVLHDRHPIAKVTSILETGIILANLLGLLGFI